MQHTPDTDNTEEKRLGLDPSDVDSYHVNDGVQEDPGMMESVAEEKKRSGSKAGIIFAFILGMLCCAGIALLCTQVLDLGHFVDDRTYDYYTGLSESYGKYYEIMKLIGEDPIATSEPHEISEEELKEIVANIGDPYAQYFTAEEYEEFQRRYMGDYVGIGISVMQEGENIVIKSVFEDTPAEDAGIQPEDVIILVDGTEPADVDEAIEMISGDPGTEVAVTVRRGEEDLEFKMKRAKIDTESVGYATINEDPSVGYIRILSFSRDTDKEFKEAVRSLKAEGCDKFILDLRDNGGGLTDVCIEIADYLLPACKIMSENTKDGTEKVYNSKESSADLNMVVLVNENTASASEILTAALQDNGAAKVIGTLTYGKGVTQTVREFSDGSAVKITATEYFRPNGNTVNEVGITPDIEAEGEEVLDAALKELKE